MIVFLIYCCGLPFLCRVLLWEVTIRSVPCLGFEDDETDGLGSAANKMAWNTGAVDASKVVISLVLEGPPPPRSGKGQVPKSCSHHSRGEILSQDSQLFRFIDIHSELGIGGDDRATPYAETLADFLLGSFECDLTGE